MSFEEQSIKEYSEKFSKLGINSYGEKILELSQTEKGRNSLYKEAIRQNNMKIWENIFPKLKLDIKSILDIGAGYGEMITTAQKEFGAEADWVDPYHKGYSEEVLGQFLLENKKINIYNKKWEEFDPKENYDLIIKTYVPWVNWGDILSKTKSKYIISNTEHMSGIIGYKHKRVLRYFKYQNKSIGNIVLIERV